jgi:hypothetical protein
MNVDRLLSLYEALHATIMEAKGTPIGSIERWKLTLKFNKLREKIHEETAGQVSIVELSQACAEASAVAPSGEVGTDASTGQGLRAQ